jgi:hypothetical protein
MVLNALAVPAPTAPEMAPYKTFTQDNVFTSQTKAVLPQKVLLDKGMTLDQIGGFLIFVPRDIKNQKAIGIHIVSGKRRDVTTALLTYRFAKVTYDDVMPGAIEVCSSSRSELLHVVSVAWNTFTSTG